MLEVPIDIGTGPPVVVFHGFAMRPATYRALADELAPRCRVLIPDLFAVRGRWGYDRILRALTAALDQRGLERVTMVGHSFGGAIQLGFASSFPERTVELVFSDTLAVSREWRLADESLRHPLRLLRLATPKAASAFVRSWVEHPLQLADAAWWAFTEARDRIVHTVGDAGLPAHVLWANRDSVLSRSDGEAFAGALGASFTVAYGSGHTPIDHDWMFQQPALFVDYLERLGLHALYS
ncbi:MAG: alpha/beta hydrolase [Acidimicrobiales bacterium]